MVRMLALGGLLPRPKSPGRTLQRTLPLSGALEDIANRATAALPAQALTGKERGLSSTAQASSRPFQPSEHRFIYLCFLM